MSVFRFKKLVDNKLKFGLFLLAKLPSAFICGVRVKYFDESKCIITVPYRWLSQNPFNSIYFACQAMAAEMSTGLLAMGHCYQLPQSISMLITGLDAVFVKKASERIYFECTDGDAIRSVINQVIETNESRVIAVTSIGKNISGEEVSRFVVKWSFKAKQS